MSDSTAPPPNSDTNNKPFTVCVFCGASSGDSPRFLEAAESLAEVLHKSNYNLVYGGGTVGLMGTVSKTLVKLSGPEAVHGIIPRALIRFEQNGTPPPVGEFGRTTVVPDMHTRKGMMAREADAFVALPGGFGTLEELMEIITWNQLGIHACPIVVYNVDGFWDGILEWAEKAVEKGFVKPSMRGVLVEAKTAEEVLEKIRTYKVVEGRLNLDWKVEGPEGKAEKRDGSDN
ncbi:hypothetical protein EX30DRAFT_361358 [Ascodesmis nigricans]|uniref:Lysine decarboxylase-like protein-like protein n=1 Tax=Ascodesmis nigricans TaxID=341454 RepID=A0A4S2N862_9PEZI|nr:hypothetical protein EX30DRAFT_361358 [Ascodesmis nigricans]